MFFGPKVVEQAVRVLLMDWCRVSDAILIGDLLKSFYLQREST